MFVIIVLLSIWAFSETLSYGIEEIKVNKSGGIIVIILSVVSLLLPIIVTYIKGFY